MPILGASQTKCACSIRERPYDLAGQGSVRQVLRQSVEIIAMYVWILSSWMQCKEEQHNEHRISSAYHNTCIDTTDDKHRISVMK